MATRQAIQDCKGKVAQRWHGDKGEGLPIINAMVVQDSFESSITMIDKAAQWMTDDELHDLTQLLVREGDWVGTNHDVTGTPEEVLTAFGLDDPADLEMYHVPPEVTDPLEVIIFILRNSWYWGEFLGGVVAGMVTFTPEQRERVRPQLMESIRKATETGVDH